MTPRDYRRALHHARNVCTYCAEPFSTSNPLEWHHIIPIARGGRHSVGNLAPSCKRCNRNKQIKFITEWRARRVVWVGGTQKAATEDGFDLASLTIL
ncbi:HNH endonuclease [Leucobacter sp. NPDC015123]|uniref:HNH endonuclease n=1 Tax=Leucobacter sp. NPDC015123 TaxID=3364129 RepID=UPI0036F482CB